MKTPHNQLDFWQRFEPPGTFAVDATFADVYPAALADRRQLLLPIRALPNGRNAVASLILNQASFAVVDALATIVSEKLARLRVDVVVGVPTLGLTLAAAVAERLGHSRYVPLGTSRKFWYDEELSVALSSITSPDVAKRLYIDPRMLPLLAGRRIALVDDVISSGVSIAAAIDLLARCAAPPLTCAAAMMQTQRWRDALDCQTADRIIWALQTPLLTRTEHGSWRAEG